MSVKTANDDVPESMIRAFGRLERLTGRIPLGQAMTAIALIGLLVTGLLMTLIWSAERQRQQDEFGAQVTRYQLTVQSRLEHQQKVLELARHWAAEQARFSGTWLGGGVAVMRPADLDAGAVSARFGIDESVAIGVARCLREAHRSHEVTCPVPAGSSHRKGWLLALASIAPAQGWVVSVLWQDQLLSDLMQDEARPVTLDLLVGRPDGVQDSGESLQAARPLRAAGMDLSLTASSSSWHRSWRALFRDHLSAWIACGAGLFFTLAAAHMYLMLISTRLRAKAMSSDMSAALQRTQSRNRAVMDTAPDAILMLDSSGVVRWCNQAISSIFGLPQDRVLGQGIQVVLPALEQEGLDHWFQNSGFSNRVIGYETMGLRNEGVPFPVAVSASRVVVDGELIQTFIVRDTTDAKWAEQELTLRDRALAASADGVVIVSMALPNHPMIYANKAFEQISGYDVHELLGMNCKLLQRDDVHQPGIEVMRAAIREGRGCQVVLRNYRKDGALFYNELAISPVLSPDGVLSHYVGVATDITERIAAEQVLKSRTDRLNAVFDLSPDGFVVLDRRGEVSNVNPAFERMTGLLAADLVGQSRDALEEQLLQRCRSHEVMESAAAEADGGPAASRELLHLHIPCVRTLIRRERNGEQGRETVMYFRDITHELEVDRMKSDFLAMAAHELRTPMVSIFGFTELLLKRQFSEERRNEMLSTIHRQASILINLVNELLDLARIESRRGKDLKRERQPLQPIIENAIAGLLMHNDARRVVFTLPAEPIMVGVDREKLSLALTNVLSNAYKYSPQGGDICLDLIWRDRGGRMECGLQVTDHGLGMTSEQLDKVFERFFRADTSGNIPGTGLGMTIVKEIVELHGGQVTLASELGVGTVVTLWIPALDVPPGRMSFSGQAVCLPE